MKMACICENCAHFRIDEGENYCKLDREEFDDEPETEDDCEGFYDSFLASEDEYWDRYNWIEQYGGRDDYDD